jgi:prepilin-type N-terminal cleavage/methylation domain-containing protein
MPTRHQTAPRRGFTLIELLVVIAILVVLAALVFVIGKGAIAQANNMRDTSTMRQVFDTIPLYAADHNGVLPGPINTGVKAVYGPQSTGRLSYYVAEYFGYVDPKRDEFLDAMSYSWQRDERSRNAPCAYIREDVPLAVGTGTIKPFGHPLRSGADRVPMSMAAVFAQIDPARTWAISDLDQQHPDIGSPSWKADIPVEMSHGKFRIAIYFDGHAGKLDKDNKPR